MISQSLSRQFENDSSNIFNIINDGRSGHGGNRGPRITKQGRMFGVADKFDAFYLIRAKEINGRKILAVQECDSRVNANFKSSTVSTGSPFFNIQRLCKYWFGDSKLNWEKILRLVEESNGIAYYEVIE